MNNQTEKPNYYAVLPASIRYDKNISSSEKLLYAEITALSNVHGYCYASNSYFSKLYEVKNSTISLWVKNLTFAGHIKVDIIREGKQIVRRNIYPLHNTVLPAAIYLNNTSQNIEIGYSENQNRGSQKIGIGYSENPKENNTSNNTIKNRRERKSANAPLSPGDFSLPKNILEHNRVMALLANLLNQPKWKKKSKEDIQLMFDNFRQYHEEFWYDTLKVAVTNKWQSIVFSDTQSKYIKWRNDNPSRLKRRKTDF